MTGHPWPLGPVDSVRPADVGWDYCGLRIVRLEPGAALDVATGDSEVAVLPLSGGGFGLDVEGQHFDLAGRVSVFERVTDWVYAPLDAELHLSASGDAPVEIAVASARATRRFDPAHIPAAAVPVELRGAGPATRQVTNFMAPEVFDGADRLMCVELLTPDGNWSSYPPHRHDASPECPVNNEELYYFRIGRLDGVGYAPDGFALHRTYTPEGDVDANVVVGDGEVFVIPRGYHGPCVAAPGYPLYYLNVLAGPGGERSMAFCDDPAHHWVRDSWDGMPTDPRCPMTTADGPVTG